MATSAELTLNSGLARECPKNVIHSGVGRNYNNLL